MNTTHDEQELTRWLDGGMNEAELTRFEARLRTDPVMRSEAEAMKQLCLQVKSHFPRIADVPHPDFFNSQVQERISELDLADRQRQERASPWLRWLHRPWLVLAGATAVLLLVGISVFQQDRAGDGATTLLNTFAPDSSIQPRTYHSEDANATVLELDGVEDIPADSDVVSFKVHRRDAVRYLARAAPHSNRDEVLPVLAMNDVR